MEAMPAYHASIHLNFTGEGREDIWSLLDALEVFAKGDDSVKLGAVHKEVRES